MKRNGVANATSVLSGKRERGEKRALSRFPSLEGSPEAHEEIPHVL